jgi:hypothetical protein
MRDPAREQVRRAGASETVGGSVRRARDSDRRLGASLAAFNCAGSARRGTCRFPTRSGALSRLTGTTGRDRPSPAPPGLPLQNHGPEGARGRPAPGSPPLARRSPPSSATREFLGASHCAALDVHGGRNGPEGPASARGSAAVAAPGPPSSVSGTGGTQSLGQGRLSTLAAGEARGPLRGPPHCPRGAGAPPAPLPHLRCGR